MKEKEYIKLQLDTFFKFIK